MPYDSDMPTRPSACAAAPACVTRPSVDLARVVEAAREVASAPGSPSCPSPSAALLPPARDDVEDHPTSRTRPTGRYPADRSCAVVLHREVRQDRCRSASAVVAHGRAERHVLDRARDPVVAADGLSRMPDDRVRARELRLVLQPRRTQAGAPRSRRRDRSVELLRTRPAQPAARHRLPADVVDGAAHDLRDRAARLRRR